MLETVSTIRDWLVAIGVTTAVLGAVTLALLIWLRTRSTHSLMNRLWSAFDRKSDTSDQTVERLLKAQSALMRFRFTTGLPVRTLAHVHRLERWLIANEENVDAVKACGSYFDLETPALKDDRNLPGTITQGLLALVSISLLVASVLLVVGAVQSSAILQTKKTEVLFFLSNKTASMFWSDFSFDSTACNADRSNIQIKSGFQKNEVDAVCDLLKNSAPTTYLQDTVRSQRIVFSYFAIFLGIYALMAGRYGLNGGQARAMAKRIRSRATTSSVADPGQGPAPSAA
ncbi:hypothetical protein C7414_110124 [Cupriavidus alkaliphilus]|uniref:DUF6216 family protein n=1 Tax=Cupriavidus alkaliphilus TaxID=942866 RepID=UPI000DE6E8B3|nr:DUF6216 family protein [Cupriavidus alkaliphilus]PVY76126.1 hypothetical protein C7414_110124 [Cupriavidus alkaliphilus]